MSGEKFPCLHFPCGTLVVSLWCDVESLHKLPASALHSMTVQPPNLIVSFPAKLGLSCPQTCLPAPTPPEASACHHTLLLAQPWP